MALVYVDPLAWIHPRTALIWYATTFAIAHGTSATEPNKWQREPVVGSSPNGYGEQNDDGAGRGHPLRGVPAVGPEMVFDQLGSMAWNSRAKTQPASGTPKTDPNPAATAAVSSTRRFQAVQERR